MIKGIIGFFACVLVLVASVLPVSKAAAENNVAVGIALAWAPVYVAEQQGLFKKNGLDVHVLTLPSGRAAQDSIVGGAALWGTVAETPTVFAALNGIPVRVIANMATYEVFDLVANTGIKSLSDLKGKRIGYAQGTNAQVYLARALEKADLTMKDINAINLSPTDMVTSLAQGQLDGFIWTEPFLSQAMHLGKGRFHIIRTPKLYFSYALVVVLEKTVTSRKADLVKSVCALKEAIKYMKAHRKESIATVAQRIKMDPAIVASEWDRANFGITLNKALIIKEMRREADWALSSRLVRPDAKLPDEIITTSVIDDANSCSN